jgi:hypothetical protein
MLATTKIVANEEYVGTRHLPTTATRDAISNSDNATHNDGNTT